MCYCELIAGNAKITLKVSKLEGKYRGPTRGPTPDSNPGFLHLRGFSGYPHHTTGVLKSLLFYAQQFCVAIAGLKMDLAFLSIHSCVTVCSPLIEAILSILRQKMKLQ